VFFVFFLLISPTSRRIVRRRLLAYWILLRRAPAMTTTRSSPHPGDVFNKLRILLERFCRSCYPRASAEDVASDIICQCWRRPAQRRFILLERERIENGNLPLILRKEVRRRAQQDLNRRRRSCVSLEDLLFDVPERNYDGASCFMDFETKLAPELQACLRLRSEGRTNEGIAQELRVSVRTVGTRRRAIRQAALRYGLVPPGNRRTSRDQ
jgi:DNA-directed RNA polymerase specialized sigma24 family protein